MTLRRSLPCVAAADARLLVLGSMPGALSLERGEYYAHPRNQFWPILFATFGAADPGPYAARVAFALEHHIALWDVLESCEREGSLDARIVAGSERPNDIVGFLQRHRQVRAIALNGGKAAQSFRRWIAADSNVILSRVAILTMPSTSPAHAVPLAIKLASWKAAFEAARD